MPTMVVYSAAQYYITGTVVKFGNKTENGLAYGKATPPYKFPSNQSQIKNTGTLHCSTLLSDRFTIPVIEQNKILFVAHT